jgi:hypothetical protein
MDLGHLVAWSRMVQDAVESIVAGFEDSYGYPPAGNVIEGPDELGTARLAAAGSAVPADLLDLYAAVGAVNLPDVGNGLFLHSAARVVDAHEARELWRIAGRHQADVIVFASDGGGTLYALASPTGSPVFRLPAGQVVGGVYESGDPRFEIVAASLAGFLGGLRYAVDQFAATGRIVEL